MTLEEQAKDFLRWRIRNSRAYSVNGLARAIESDRERSRRGLASRSGYAFSMPPVDKLMNSRHWRNAALSDFADGDE